ncbi:MAG: hypothetical protein KDJ88_16225 [Bauldia sp.]|nr:hypothetical protein [Bauldia sp.]
MADQQADASRRGPAAGPSVETPEQAKWPPGIRGIAMEELDALGIDVNRQLYWHGKPIQFGQTLVLSTRQKAYAIILGFGALLAFLSTFAQGWVAAFTWMCQVGWIHTWCAVN